MLRNGLGVGPVYCGEDKPSSDRFVRCYSCFNRLLLMSFSKSSWFQASCLDSSSCSIDRPVVILDGIVVVVVDSLRSSNSVVGLIICLELCCKAYYSSSIKEE
jgi:hypothetical protein